jgi:hypothetical protein
MNQILQRAVVLGVLVHVLEFVFITYMLYQDNNMVCTVQHWLLLKDGYIRSYYQS